MPIVWFSYSFDFCLRPNYLSALCKFKLIFSKFTDSQLKWTVRSGKECEI